jgi:hypothetical protein
MDTSSIESFFRASRNLTHALKADCNFSELDQLRLENHLAVMHIAYVEWKKRNGPPSYLTAPFLTAPLSERRLEDREHNFRSSI